MLRCSHRLLALVVASIASFGCAVADDSSPSKTSNDDAGFDAIDDGSIVTIDGAPDETNTNHHDGSPTDGGGADVVHGDGGSDDAPPAGSLPLGVVTATSATPGGCDATDHPANLDPAKCTDITVECPDVAPQVATVLVAEPTTPAIGTIVMHNGSAGNVYYTAEKYEPGRLALAKGLLASGFRIVEIKWATGWPTPTPGKPANILSAACRPATAIHWAFENVHLADRSKGFCGYGFSGGSAAMGYSLAHYGLDADFDHVMLAQGPPFGRVDCGCDPSAPECDVPNLCAISGPVPVAFTNNADYVGRLDGTTTCGKPSPPASDITTWRASSVLSPTGAALDYPHTAVSAWYCKNSNETLGLGSFYVSKISALGGAADVHCAEATGSGPPGCVINPTSGGTENVVDGYESDGTKIVDSMIAAFTDPARGCHPHH